MRQFCLALLCCIGLAVAAAENNRRLTVSTTIDYLDYVFYDREDGHDWYPVEVWETRLKEIADCGIRKIYLRVNACGLTLWPSKVSAMYGQDGRMHFEYPEQGRRLAKTLQTYDCLAETIRIGHKYGMEVWCWHSVWDDGAYHKSAEDFPEEVAKYGSYPMADTWYGKKQDHGWSRRDPRLDSSPSLAESDPAVRPVAKIVLVSEVPSNLPVKFTKENLRIYVSDRNGDYRPYEGDYRFKAGHTADNRQTVTFDGLCIRNRCVKLWHDTLDERFGFILGEAVSRDCHIYDADGNELAVTWGQTLEKEKRHDPVKDKMGFSHLFRFGWDWKNYQLGFIAGRAPDGTVGQWLVGVPEYTVPDVMEHKVDQFRELAAYPFDGFVYNIRSHSTPLANVPTNYGFNPEVREKFLKRYGVDIYTQDFDREALNEMRSEALDEFLKRCKALAGKRPLYMTVGKQPEAKNHAADWSYKMGARWHYDKWFKDGSVDGVTIMGVNYANEFDGKTVNGHPVHVAVFREMGFPPKGYDLMAEMEALERNERVDELELYETLALTAEKRKIIEAFHKGGEEK